jgi:outer membrane protein OmpA-like peptidoglycan-associated protein
MSQTSDGNEKYNAWTWGIAALLALALLWLWINGKGLSSNCCGAGAVAAAPTLAPAPAANPAPAPAPMPAPAPASAQAVVPAAPTAAAAAAASAATPAAPATPAAQAKPIATLYFDTGKTSAPAGTSSLIADVVAYLQKNTASKAVISGYNDPSGNAATNAELSKNRAKSAREALKAAGIDEARIELRKPSDTNLAGDARAARRVEITVEP